MNPNDPLPSPDPIDPSVVITCWCGARGTASELFDTAVFSQGPCGGLGVLHCECGGDFCVCHNHGEVPCPGCSECRPDDDFDDDDMDYDYEDAWDDRDFDGNRP